MDEHRLRDVASNVAVRIFIGVVLIYGVTGMFAQRIWIERGLGIDLGLLDPVVRHTFLSEYSFLSGREAGIGLFALIFRREIVESRRFNGAFLAMIALSPLGRVCALLVEGAPRRLWNGFLLVEVGFVVVFWALTRQTRVGSGRQLYDRRVPAAVPASQNDSAAPLNSSTRKA